MMQQHGCKVCGLHHQCLCSVRPHFKPDWRLVLLTHPNEFRRDTNTGKLLATSIENCEVMEWQRSEPPAQLLSDLASGHYRPAVLFPSESSQPLSSPPLGDDPRPWLFILLDGTWQEAKKMHNRSSWLKALPHYHLQVEGRSDYSLRRNQQPGHLCSCEVGAALLRETHYQTQAEQLEHFFQLYLNVFQADKSGHVWHSLAEARSSSGSPK